MKEVWISGMFISAECIYCLKWLSFFWYQHILRVESNILTVNMKPFLFILALLSGSLAATVTYNWDINWVEAAPDGFKRPVIGESLHSLHATEVDVPAYSDQREVPLACSCGKRKRYCCRQCLQWTWQWNYWYPFPWVKAVWNSHNGRPFWCESMLHSTWRIIHIYFHGMSPWSSELRVPTDIHRHSQQEVSGITVITKANILMVFVVQWSSTILMIHTLDHMTRSWHLRFPSMLLPQILFDD